MAGYKLTQEVWLEANAFRLPAVLTNISALILRFWTPKGRPRDDLISEHFKYRRLCLHQGTGRVAMQQPCRHPLGWQMPQALQIFEVDGGPCME